MVAIRSFARWWWGLASRGLRHEEPAAGQRRMLDGLHDGPWPEPEAATAPPSTLRKSASLHKYLDDRFAVALVLTFGEIEDLVGCPLPESARRHAEWWTTPDRDGTGSPFADSWTLANRTARPNLQARTVAFDRTA
jgi:hypothetical protein